MRAGRGAAPAAVLLFLSAFVAEPFSGATPPAQFFLAPNLLLGFSLYYGSGAILVRELAFKWRKGWPGIFLLGAAFGVIQEGLGTKVFFDPTRVELSPLVNYGTVAGVHAPFVVQLVIYHAVYSIAIPILLVELMFPGRRAERWVGRRGLVLYAASLAVLTWLLYLIYPFRPPAGPYLLAAGSAAALVALARILPRRPTMARERPVPGAFRLWLLGFAAAAGFFLTSFAFPGWGAPPWLTAAVLAGIAATVGRLVLRWSRVAGAWTSQRQLALATGLLSLFIALAPVQEARGRTGSLLVAMATAALLAWLWRKVARHAREVPTEQQAASAPG